jgi:hypothetical protein
LNQDSVTALLLDCYQKSRKRSASRLETHNLLTQIVADLASQFGLQAVGEYSLQCPDGIERFIDVVWLSGSRPIAAFEIDSSLRAKSLKKLLNISAKFRFWVYYGQKDPASFVGNIDSENRIIIVCTHHTSRKPMNPKTNSVATATTTSQEITTLLVVDQHIRQAIQHCWTALPEEERSLKRVEQEITRLVQRALRDIEEDSLAFREPVFSKTKAKSIADPRLAKIRARHPRAYERWTEEEDNLLKQKFSDGVSVQDLSELLQRRPSAIRSRLRKSGLM